MTKTRMIHKNDEIKRRFIQVDLLLLENPKYEKLSDGAILAYAILRNRLDLSRKNAEVYSDEDGYLFLIYTDEELAKILHRCRKTANTRKRQLEEAGLLKSVRTGLSKPNRIYLLEPETCETEEYISQEFKKEKEEERIEKEAAKKEAKKSYPQAQTLGAQLKSKKVTSRRVKKLHQEVTKLDTIYTDLNDPDFNDTEFLEEEEGAALQKINSYFPTLIKEVLGTNGIYDDNMIANIIVEMKKRNFTFLTKNEMTAQHHKMLKKRDKGDVIWDWANYFVGGIAKNRLSESSAVNQQRLSEQKKFEQYTKEPEKPMSFYNWLED